MPALLMEVKNRFASPDLLSAAASRIAQIRSSHRIRPGFVAPRFERAGRVRFRELKAFFKREIER
jgi:hypothetical protein